jgi:hypothetical protein
MTALAGAWDRPAAAVPAASARVRIPDLGGMLFATALAGYFGLGAYLALVLHAMNGDAYSRVTNAYYAVFSRDPHLAAIGFVWPPLPTLFELALVPLKVVWPPMVEQGVAAVIMSAVFMAGAVYQLSRTLGEFAVPRLPRFLLVAAFALHPMIVYYGAVGASEAPTIFFMVLTVRHLTRWVREPAVGPLVMTGVGLAGAYLTRYEAMFSALAAAGLVALFTLARTEGRARVRIDAAVADVAIMLAPFVLAFGSWALASWMIVGAPFEQFTSVYGGASQVSIALAQGGGEWLEPLAVKAGLALRRLGTVEVALPSAIGLAALVGWRRRDDRWFAVVAVLAPPVAFLIFAYLTNTLFPWFRHLILAVPMGFLLLGLTIGGLAQGSEARAAAGRAKRAAVAALRGVTISSLALAAFLCVPTAGVAMLDPTIAITESRDLAGVLGPSAAADDRPAGDLRTFATEREIADYLDRLGLPSGSVLLDVFGGFAIVGQSANPNQFVITPDRDFRAILADPPGFGVRYLLAPSVRGLGVVDAVNVTYPTLEVNGTGFTVLDHTFAGRGGTSDWALYRVASP